MLLSDVAAEIASTPGVVRLEMVRMGWYSCWSRGRLTPQTSHTLQQPSTRSSPPITQGSWTLLQDLYFVLAKMNTSKVEDVESNEALDLRLLASHCRSE